MSEEVPRASGPATGDRPAGKSSRRRVRIALLLILLLASAVRLVRLDEPDPLVFDETYYAKDACIYLDYPAEECELDQAGEQSYVHPPLGKWIISVGIQAFGFTPVGWRVMAALFGVGLVLLVWRLTESLFDTSTALLASLLVAADFLLIVQSRIAMLDIFLVFFVVLGYWFVALDRQNVLAVRAQVISDGSGEEPSRGRTMRIAAGAAFGLALAVKWSAVYPMAAAGLFTLAWSFGLLRLRRSTAAGKAPRSLRRAHLKEVAILALAFGLVPLSVYVGSYVDYFGQRLGADCAFVAPGADSGRILSGGSLGLEEAQCVEGVGGSVLAFVDLHDRVADYHLTLDATHPYQSQAWTWPLVLRPVAYHWDSVQVEPEDTQVRHIVAMGNPLVWIGSLVAGLWLIWRSRRRWTPESVVAGAWAVQYLPWLLVARPLFLFYMAPAVPFMMIGLAAGLNTLRRKGRTANRLVWLYLVVGVGIMLALFYPVLTAVEMPYDIWRRLMWIGNFDCGELTCGWI
ncbi:MAG: phospholipid carrier-dependent glycosyltransferase [Actinobacteria bacterium]|nr:phospholipid carrier-dependent glycosyltransferase [Actinomycetota bacterium]